MAAVLAESEAGCDRWLCFTDLVSRLVVCVPTLRLKLEEDCNPLVLRRKVNEHAAVLPHTIIVQRNFPRCSDSCGCRECRCPAGSRSTCPSCSSPVPSARRRHRLLPLRRQSALHDVINLLVEIIIKTGHVERQRPHFRAVEEVPADVVKSVCPWLARDLGEAERHFL